MAYYPYFRGKQFELIAIRESAALIAESGFVPIIEPVRSSLGALKRALDSIVEAGAQCVVIVNPQHGDHSVDGSDVETMLADEYGDRENIAPGILLLSDTSDDDVVRLLTGYRDRSGVTLIHAGYTNSQAVGTLIAGREDSIRHVFLDDKTTIIYRTKRFDSGARVLVKDGFERKKNSEYRGADTFSDLHVLYADHHGMDGYGDFLVVGDTYSETGGPAYAVAIHMTYIDPDQDDVMFVRHFVSKTNDTPTDPAGKFKEALDALIAYADGGESKLEETEALGEFRQLHARQHFPGLGSVKKLSMRHHLETLSRYHAT